MRFLDRFRRKLTKQPPLPHNVRLVTSTGREIPVELVYDGWNKQEGMHIWTAVAWAHLEPEECHPLSLSADRIPGHTSIEVLIKTSEPVHFVPLDEEP